MKTKKVLGAVMADADISLFSVDMVHAQRGGGRMMGMMGGQNNQFALLANKDIQEQLDLVDDQVKELESIQEEAMQIMRDMFAEMQDLPREERGEAMRGMREKIQEKMKPMESKIKDVLLPHQHDRLKQLGFQNSGRNEGAGGALMNDTLLEELDVTDKQREELEEAMEKAKEDLKKEYAKLVKKAEEKVLKVLDAEQRKKYRDMVGEPFQFQERRGWGGGRTGGNDRGGRDRGGRGGRGR